MVQLTSPAGFPPSPRDKSRLILFMALAAVRTPSMRARASDVFERGKISRLKALANDRQALAQSVEEFNAGGGRDLRSEDAQQFIERILLGEATLKLTNRAEVIAPL